MELMPIESSDADNIPDDVLIPCPMRKFDNRRAAKCCPGCEHFRGLVVVQEPSTWPQGYRIFCAHPIARRVSMIVEE
ncbi:hypothetical protein LCGC14_1271680 [marine sediment metagenome]|uniref:Uncharacterized protein n=1 Tax=marine sediment metagenome TaxID=412755 RepID=A0A0F9LIZ4_9ZZZZ